MGRDFLGSGAFSFPTPASPLAEPDFIFPASLLEPSPWPSPTPREGVLPPHQGLLTHWPHLLYQDHDSSPSAHPNSFSLPGNLICVGQGRGTGFGGFACREEKDGAVVVNVVESGGGKVVCKTGLVDVIGSACVVSLVGTVGSSDGGNSTYAVKWV